MTILLKLIDIYSWNMKSQERFIVSGANKRKFYKPSDNVQRRNNVISMLLHKYEAGWRRIDVVLTSV